MDYRKCAVILYSANSSKWSPPIITFCCAYPTFFVWFYCISSRFYSNSGVEPGTAGSATWSVDNEPPQTPPAPVYCRNLFQYGLVKKIPIKNLPTHDIQQQFVHHQNIQDRFQLVCLAATFDSRQSKKYSKLSNTSEIYWKFVRVYSGLC